jgi:hypothetical protein
LWMYIQGMKYGFITRIRDRPCRLVWILRSQFACDSWSERKR